MYADESKETSRSLWRPGERSERTTFEVFIKQLRCNRNLTGHNGAYRFILLFSFQLSFFLWTTLSLFLMFLFAFIFLSLIAHVCFSVIENECSALRFLLFKQGTPRPVTRQVPSVKGCRRTSASYLDSSSLASSSRAAFGCKAVIPTFVILRD